MNDDNKQSQSYKFKQAARDLETDNDENRFDETLGKIAKAKRACKAGLTGSAYPANNRL